MPVAPGTPPQRAPAARVFWALWGTACLTGLAAFALVLMAIFHWGDGPLTEERVLMIPAGVGGGVIARQLHGAGVIEHPFLFAAIARLSGAGRRLQAGEYAFAPGVSGARVLRQIEEGEVFYRAFTLPEGVTVAVALESLATAPGLVGEAEEAGEEGRLLPETYYYTWGEARDALVARMEEAMAAALTSQWAVRQEGLPLDTPREALILASIVEKETALAEERPLIAAVFLNRLRRGMRLQSDPTVAYALSPRTGTLERSLQRRDLKHPSPFNTYLHAGLPPAPICNPGIDAIRAVLHPAASEALYFVADGNGGHAFARTLKEHNRNVARWRRLNGAP